MAEAENHALPGPTNDTWRTWLMTGARRAPIDRRRARGADQGLKRMLLEGMTRGGDRPHAWHDFSGAMLRHSVEDAMRTLPVEDNQVVKLAYFGGYSNREIAVETGLTEATVQRRLRRALATISEHVQHGRALGRRAMYALLIWLSGRWLADLASHAAPAVVVAAVTVIVAAQPPGPPAPPVTPPVTPPAATRHDAAPVTHSGEAAPPPAVVPAPPSPAVPALPSLAVPTPSIELPVALPSPPVHVPALRA